MTPRRRSPKPSAKTDPKNGTLATGVLVEQFRSEMKVIAEGLLDRPTRTELAVKFDRIDEKFAHIDDQFEDSKARFAKLENQIALLIDAVTWTREDSRQTREDIRSLRQDLANQSQASELRVLDRRVTVLEQQRVGG
jgi:septation ring formation regulator EzrA